MFSTVFNFPIRLLVLICITNTGVFAELVIYVDPFKKEYYLSGSATGSPLVDPFGFGSDIFWENDDPYGNDFPNFLSLEAFNVTGNTAISFAMFFHNTGNINGVIEFDSADSLTLEGNSEIKHSYADWSAQLIAEIESKAKDGELIPMISSNYDEAFVMRFQTAATPPPVIGIFVGIVIDGAVGLTYQVEYTVDILNPDWQPLDEITLLSTPFVFSDPTPLNQITEPRYYRVSLVTDSE